MSFAQAAISSLTNRLNSSDELPTVFAPWFASRREISGSFKALIEA